MKILTTISRQNAKRIKRNISNILSKEKDNAVRRKLITAYLDKFSSSGIFYEIKSVGDVTVINCGMWLKSDNYNTFLYNQFRFDDIVDV